MTLPPDLLDAARTLANRGRTNVSALIASYIKEKWSEARKKAPLVSGGDGREGNENEQRY
jgi:hypothetical protein